MVDDAAPVTYDRLDWHFDSAIAAGQPPENAFTHIGLYLAWIIRHDLHEGRYFPAEHVTAVKSNEMTGSDLADDIDTKLMPLLMSADGRAFSDARYGTYLDEYAIVFGDLPDYGVVDDDAAYARIAPVIDRLYAAWVSDGRPAPAPVAMPELPELDLPTPQDLSGKSREEIEALMADMAAKLGGVISSAPAWEQMPHAASRLEALVPPDITSPPMRFTSVTAKDWGSSLLRRALKRLGVRSQDATVVTGIGGSGLRTLTVMFYEVPGVDADRLEAEFATVIALPPGGKWGKREIGGRTLNWAPGREFTVALWANAGLVVHVAGNAEDVEEALPKLP